MCARAMMLDRASLQGEPRDQSAVPCIPVRHCVCCPSDSRMTVNGAPLQDISAGSPPGEVAGAWSDHIFDHPVAPGSPEAVRHLGVVEGEGIGPELMRGALDVLAALEESTPYRFAVLSVPGSAGSVGEPLRLSDGLERFCRETFDVGGAVLVGPGSGRFVYDLRRRFDLFCKLSPLRPYAELAGAGRLKPDGMRDVDVLVVRENVSGIYQ